MPNKKSITVFFEQWSNITRFLDLQYDRMKTGEFRFLRAARLNEQENDDSKKSHAQVPNMLKSLEIHNSKFSMLFFA